MWTRRDILRLTPTAALLAVSRAAEGPDFGRIDTHVHIHRDAPALLSALKESKWRGLDIVVCPAVGDEPFDLEQKLRATLKVQREESSVAHVREGRCSRQRSDPERPRSGACPLSE